MFPAAMASDGKDLPIIVCHTTIALRSNMVWAVAYPSTSLTSNNAAYGTVGSEHETNRKHQRPRATSIRIVLLAVRWREKRSCW